MGGGEKSFSGEVAKNMTLLIEQMKRGEGPAASRTDIAGIGREAQLAAIGGNPIEQEQRNFRLKVLTILEAGVAELRQRPTRQ